MELKLKELIKEKEEFIKARDSHVVQANQIEGAIMYLNGMIQKLQAEEAKPKKVKDADENARKPA